MAATDSSDNKNTSNQLNGPLLFLQRKLFRNGSIAYPPPPPKRKPGHGGPVLQPTENDVLCGRGGRINSHEGNIRFRHLVADWKPTYLDKSHKVIVKAHISAHIVDLIRELKPEGRFLKKDACSGMWVDIGDESARKKTSQALREGLAVNVDTWGKCTAKKKKCRPRSLGAKSSAGADDNNNSGCNAGIKLNVYRHLANFAHNITDVLTKVEKDKTIPSELTRPLRWQVNDINIDRTSQNTLSTSTLAHTSATSGSAEEPNTPHDSFDTKEVCGSVSYGPRDSEQEAKRSDFLCFDASHSWAKTLPAVNHTEDTITETQDTWASPFMELDDSVSSVSLLTFEAHDLALDEISMSMAGGMIDRAATYSSDAWTRSSLSFSLIDEDLISIGDASISALLSERSLDLCSELGGSSKHRRMVGLVPRNLWKEYKKITQFRTTMSTPSFSSMGSLSATSHWSILERFTRRSSCHSLNGSVSSQRRCLYPRVKRCARAKEKHRLKSSSSICSGVSPEKRLKYKQGR